jgi:hypothetical protein
MSDKETIKIDKSDIQQIKDKAIRNKVQFRYDAFVQANTEYETALQKMSEAKNELLTSFVETWAADGFVIEPDRLHFIEVDKDGVVVCEYDRPDEIA